MEYWQILRKKMGNQQLIIPSVAGAVFYEKKILLARTTEDDKWHIPGGMQNLNESITDTIERELLEEFNLKLKANILISIISSPSWIQTLSNGNIVQTLTFLFKMKGQIDLNDIKLQKSEILEYNFFKLDKIPANTKKCCKQKCKDLIEYNGKVIFH
ncbi:MAG: NUDIX domain-containing protein [bacterium]